jgi:uncharacterized protein YbjT (DUF2867 family)
MKLVVVGATGGTGKQVVERAKAAGHEVIAAVRRPEAVEGVRAVKADVLDPASLAVVFTGVDAVISTIGPANMRKPGTMLSDGVGNMVAACEACGVKRFVYESGMIAGDGKGLGIAGRLMLGLAHVLMRAFVREKQKAEAAITASSLDYVIVRPPVLVHEPARGAYIHGVDAEISLGKKLPHADVADFLIRAAGDPGLARTIQEIGET